MVEVVVDGIFEVRDSAKVFELTDLGVCLSSVQSHRVTELRPGTAREEKEHVKLNGRILCLFTHCRRIY